MKIEVLEKKTVYQGYFRLDKYLLRHGGFAGGWVGPMSRELLERGHAASVLPYDPKLERFLLCEQFRIGAYAANMEPWQIEGVAGMIDEGETPEDVCRREAVEEAGCAILDLLHIQHFLASGGGTSETTQAFLGRVDLSDRPLGDGAVFGVPGENENIKTSVLTEGEFRRLLESGRITNAPTLIAGLWFFLNRTKVRELWSTQS